MITEAVDRLAADIRKWTGNNAQIVDRKPEELAAMIASDDPLVASWRTDHIDVMGTRLLDLLRDLQRRLMSRPTGKITECTPAEARDRRDQARAFIDVAEMVLTESASRHEDTRSGQLWQCLVRDRRR